MDVPGLLILLGVGLVVGILLMSGYTGWVLTHPPRRNYAWAVSRGLPGDPGELAAGRSGDPGTHSAPAAFQEWNFRSRGRDLPVWEITGGNPGGPAVVVTHGWGDSRVVSLRCVPALARGASRVILWDCPGHGEAPGSCALGTREVDDLDALLERLAADQPGGPVVLYGFSMGAGISIASATRRAELASPPLAAVIAEAPYRRPIDPARNVLRLAGLPRTLTLQLAMIAIGLLMGRAPTWATRARGFDRVAMARRLSGRTGPIPLLVLHGTEDPVCSITDGEAIAGAAPAGELVALDGAAHNNLWTDERFASRSAEAVGAFLHQRGRGAQRDTRPVAGAPRYAPGVPPPPSSPVSLPPLFHVVLHEPEIPNNTGNIGRTCIATGCSLHLVHPLGFSTSEKACRRAGLDYWPRLSPTEHTDWPAYLANQSPSPRSLWLFSTRAARPVWEARLEPGDHLVFGKETAGLPASILDAYPERLLTLPMVPGERSLNLATAVCAVVYEGIRQLVSRGVVEVSADGRIVRKGR